MASLLQENQENLGLSASLTDRKFMDLFTQKPWIITLAMFCWTMASCDSNDKLKVAAKSNATADGEKEPKTKSSDEEIFVSTSPSCAIELKAPEGSADFQPAPGEPVNLEFTINDLPQGGIMLFGIEGDESELSIEDTDAEISALYRVMFPAIGRKYVGLVKKGSEKIAECAFELGKVNQGEAAEPLSCTLTASKTSVNTAQDAFDLVLAVAGKPDGVDLLGENVASSLSANGQFTKHDVTASADTEFVVTLTKEGSEPVTCKAQVRFDPLAPSCNVTYANANMQPVTTIQAPASYFVVVDYGSGGQVTTLSQQRSGQAAVNYSVNAALKNAISDSVLAPANPTLSHSFTVSGPGGSSVCSGTLNVTNPQVPTCQLAVIQGGQERTNIVLTQATSLAAIMRFSNATVNPSGYEFSFAGSSLEGSNANPSTRSIHLSSDGTVRGSFTYLGTTYPCGNSVAVTFDAPQVPTCQVQGYYSSDYRTSVEIPYYGTRNVVFQTILSSSVGVTNMQIRQQSNATWVASGSLMTFSTSEYVLGRFTFNGQQESCSPGSAIILPRPDNSVLRCQTKFRDSQTLQEVTSISAGRAVYIDVSTTGGAQRSGVQQSAFNPYILINQPSVTTGPWPTDQVGYERIVGMAVSASGETVTCPAGITVTN